VTVVKAVEDHGYLPDYSLLVLSTRPCSGITKIRSCPGIEVAVIT
jgi:hypothetical protein